MTEKKKGTQKATRRFLHHLAPSLSLSLPRPLPTAEKREKCLQTAQKPRGKFLYGVRESWWFVKINRKSFFFHSWK